MTFAEIEHDEPPHELTLVLRERIRLPRYRRLWGGIVSTVSKLWDAVVEEPLVAIPTLVLCGALLLVAAALATVGVGMLVLCSPMLFWMGGLGFDSAALLLIPRPGGAPPRDGELTKLEAKRGRLMVKTADGTKRMASIEQLRVRLGPAGGGPVPLHLERGNEQFFTLLEDADDHDKATAVAHRLACACGLSQFERDGDVLLYSNRNKNRGHPYRAGSGRAEPIPKATDKPARNEPWRFAPADFEGELPDGWRLDDGRLHMGIDMAWPRLKGMLAGLAMSLSIGLFVWPVAFLVGTRFGKGDHVVLMASLLAVANLLFWLPRQLKGGWRLPDSLHRKVGVHDGKLHADGRSTPLSKLSAVLIVERRNNLEAWAIGERDVPLFRLKAAEDERRGAMRAALSLAEKMDRPWILVQR